MSETPEFLRSGQRARLIPVVADTSKEERAASIFLSTLSAVPLFGREMLATLGQRIGKRTQIDCYTEVEFRTTAGSPNLRPDGLLIVTQGDNRWCALIETKIGRPIGQDSPGMDSLGAAALRVCRWRAVGCRPGANLKIEEPASFPWVGFTDHTARGQLQEIA